MLSLEPPNRLGFSDPVSVAKLSTNWTEKWAAAVLLSLRCLFLLVTLSLIGIELVALELSSSGTCGWRKARRFESIGENANLRGRLLAQGPFSRSRGIGGSIPKRSARGRSWHERVELVRGRRGSGRGRWGGEVVRGRVWGRGRGVVIVEALESLNDRVKWRWTLQWGRSRAIYQRRIYCLAPPLSPMSEQLKVSSSRFGEGRRQRRGGLQEGAATIASRDSTKRLTNRQIRHRPRTDEEIERL